MKNYMKVNSIVVSDKKAQGQGKCFATQINRKATQEKMVEELGTFSRVTDAIR